MKTIDIAGKVLKYEPCSHNLQGWLVQVFTNFYEEKEITIKKWNWSNFKYEYHQGYQTDHDRIAHTVDQ